MIVMKFGGTSVEDTAAIDRSCRIVIERLHRQPFVVVSAMAGVTNDLLEAGRLAGSGKISESLEFFERLERRHEEFLPKGDLTNLLGLLHWINEAGEFSPRAQDSVAAWGEDLCSEIFARALRRLGIEAIHIDARDFIVTDRNFGNARPLWDKTFKKFQIIPEFFKETNRTALVMGGFIGSAVEDGETTTLGRGGSDYSAAIVGAAMGAEEIQIWTDVDGMMTADPKIVSTARTIRCLSFAEASELASFGAKVLHPRTLEPAMDKNIPVYVFNSRNPGGAGTRITRDAVPCQNIVKSIACKRDVSVITVETSRMLKAVGFLGKLFTILESIGVSVDMVATSEVSVSFTLDDSSKGPQVLDALRRPHWAVSLENNLGLACLVGNDLKWTPGIAARVFGSIREFHVRMISHGASMTNLAFLVRRQQLEEAVHRLHSEFFSEFDPKVFAEPG